ncbi:DUF819 domain-containing protein [Treponema ruminis]|uniref:DUF819 family protein n=1 Tax=Treponema ruminis TaxID=744515 RepID=UPI00197DEC05|nr:DUF819 family protein [Treponema ruminis]QSI03356.1 DUF819 domain-containing protein [Treponema ruminis]
MNTLISPNDTWMLLAIMCASVALAMYLEQTKKWAANISGSIIVLVIALVLVNLRVIPTAASVFDDMVWGYAVPMAIPLLLLKTNIKRIWTETHRLLAIFLIGSVGTICGVLAAYMLLSPFVPSLAQAAAMMTGSYIGGGVNFTALADAFRADSSLTSATTVADNLNMAIYFLVLIAFARNAFLRRHYPHPYSDQAGGDKETTQAASYWKQKPISLRDIAIDLAYTVLVVTISRALGRWCLAVIPQGGWFLSMLRTFFGSQYIWITTISMLFATFCSPQAERMSGAEEIGTYLIYLFFFAIGVPASIGAILRSAPLMLLFCLIIVLVNMLFCLIGGKLIGSSLEEILLASNANIGGPTTAAGMAISQGWTKLITPCMLVGTFGYVIGTYAGVIVGTLLGA